MSPISNQFKNIRRSLALFLDPLKLKQTRVRASSQASLEEKVEWDAFSRPHFAYGVHRSALQAKALGIPRITVIEFGCAGGNGLVALEDIAEEVTKAIGVEIDIYGFDLGEGLPRPLDYRDLPYAWQAGQFKMDVPKLKARLRTAKLVLGNVSETVGPFRAREGVAPIGFISFDLDYYSSTADALRVLEGGFSHILPRVYCYFDDIIGPDHELHSEFTGELLAINEFNDRHSMLKLARINGLSHKRYIPAPWNDTLYILHAFEHPLYGQYIRPSIDLELALSE